MEIRREAADAAGGGVTKKREKSTGVRKLSEIDALMGKAGEPVPVVDVADIKAVWAHNRELQAQHPGGVGVEIDVWKQVCSPGADVRAVAERCQRLGMLEWLLRAAWTGGDFSEKTFEVAARMDLRWMAPGVAQDGLGVEEFLAQVFFGVQREASPEKTRPRRP